MPRPRALRWINSIDRPRLKTNTQPAHISYHDMQAAGDQDQSRRREPGLRRYEGNEEIVRAPNSAAAPPAPARVGRRTVAHHAPIPAARRPGARRLRLRLRLLRRPQQASTTSAGASPVHRRAVVVSVAVAGGAWGRRFGIGGPAHQVVRLRPHGLRRGPSRPCAVSLDLVLYTTVP